MLVARTLDQLAEKFPDMKADLSKHGQVYLAAGVVLDSYQVFSRTDAKSLADLKGMKINGAGTNLRYFSPVGATGVAGPLPSYYNNLQTGVVDAAVLWPEAAVTFKIAEVAKFMLKADLGSVNSKIVAANAGWWSKLPQEVRAVIQQVSYDYRDHLARVTAAGGGKSVQAYVAAGGKVNQLDDAARTAWAKSLPNLAQEWAGRMDADGKPGSKMLAAYMDALRAGGAKPLRNWDKE